MKSLILSLLLITNIAYSKVCTTDNFFEAADWDMHIDQDFREVSTSVLNNYEENKQYFVAGIEFDFFSSELNATMHFKTFDDLRTPKEEMNGDLALVTNPRTGELMEMRWYDTEGYKNIIYDEKLERCSSAIFPISENSLF